jgi:serine protease Do
MLKLKKSIIAAIALICVGIIFGVVLVSSFSGVKWGFAQNVTLGAKNPPIAAENLKALSDAYVAIAKEITPKVVLIEVVTKPVSVKNELKDFFRFFGPDVEIPDTKSQPQQGLGSGVIISSDGYILTNNHVVKDAKERDGIKVTTYDRKTFKAKLIGTDQYTELAVIKIDAKDLPVAYLGNSDESQVGQIVFAVGNPLGLNSTVTNGIISAIGRNINIIDDGVDKDGKRTGLGIENFIQTDAAISPGNSGGALVDIYGAVIGINTAIATRTGYNQGYGFAVPINLAKKVADDIIKYGKVKRGFIGIKMSPVPLDETDAKALGLPKATGVQVQEVVSGGAGEAAGIKPLDVILEVDGKEILSSNQLQDIVARKHPGDEVKLKIFRDGNTFEKNVILRESTNEPIAEDKSSNKTNEAEKSDSKNSIKYDKLGFSVKNLTKEEKKALNVNEGIIVDNVEGFGSADSRGILKGDVITDVMKKGKNTKINSVLDFDKTLKECKSGDAVMLRLKTNGTPRFVSIEIPKD